MKHLLLWVHVVVKTLSLEIPRCRFALRQRIVHKCVAHVQHDYFSSFNHSHHCFLASSLFELPSSARATYIRFDNHHHHHHHHRYHHHHNNNDNDNNNSINFFYLFFIYLFLIYSFYLHHWFTLLTYKHINTWLHCYYTVITQQYRSIVQLDQNNLSSPCILTHSHTHTHTHYTLVFIHLKHQKSLQRVSAKSCSPYISTKAIKPKKLKIIFLDKSSPFCIKFAYNPGFNGITFFIIQTT